MIPNPIDFKLTLSAGSRVHLRSGDFVSLKVIKQLSQYKWAVAVRGRVLPAYSKVELSAGQRLRALVSIQGKRTVLQITENSRNPIRSVLLEQGIAGDRAMEQILTSFLRSGLGVRPERLQEVRHLLERLRLDPKRFSRIAALALDKGIDLHSEGFGELIQVLGHGEHDGGGRKYRGRQMPPDAEALADDLQSAVEEPDSEEGSPLQIFNHLKGSTASWVIIPFDYRYGHSGHIYGTVRLRYDSRQKRTDRMVVAARAPNEQKWSFVIQRCADGSSDMYVLSGGKKISRKARQELNVLRLKLQNLCVKIDDTIREDTGFDGFSLPWEELSYRTIDTVH